MLVKGTQSRFCTCARFWFLDRMSRIQRCEKWCRTLKNLFTSPLVYYIITLNLLRIVYYWYLVYVKFIFVWNCDFLLSFSMSFDGASRGGKRYGAGRRLLSPGTFLKSSDNWERSKKKWSQQHSRLYVKKSIHETWKRLKGSCMYTSDTAFAQHLLSLEMRRRAR